MDSFSINNAIFFTMSALQKAQEKIDILEETNRELQSRLERLENMVLGGGIMALKKKIQARAGFDMEYWRITAWYINMTQNLMDITLTPYVSSETREEGLTPVMDEIRKIRVYDMIDKLNPERSKYDYSNHFSPKALENSKKSIYILMYEYIKDNVDEFSGAEDI